MTCMPISTTSIGILGTIDESSAVDRIVLAIVNAPYKQPISAAILEQSIAAADIETWPAHIANFFTDLPPDLIFRFASAHAIPNSVLAKAYRVMKTKTGEHNLDFEAALVALAPASR